MTRRPILSEERAWARTKLWPQILSAGLGLAVVGSVLVALVFRIVTDKSDQNDVWLLTATALIAVAVLILFGTRLCAVLRDWGTDHVVCVAGRVVAVDEISYTLDSDHQEEVFYRYFKPFVQRRNAMHMIAEAVTDLSAPQHHAGYNQLMRITALSHTRLITTLDRNIEKDPTRDLT